MDSLLEMKNVMMAQCLQEMVAQKSVRWKLAGLARTATQLLAFVPRFMEMAMSTVQKNVMTET